MIQVYHYPVKHEGFGVNRINDMRHTPNQKGEIR